MKEANKMNTNLYVENNRDPLPTLGGKSQIIDRICEIVSFTIQENNIVGVSDLFSGGNRLFLHLKLKRELEFKLANEIDSGVVNFFRCLQNAYEIDELIKYISLLADDYKTKDKFGEAGRERLKKGTPQILSAALTYIIVKYSRAADRQTYCQENAFKGIKIKSLDKFYFLDEIYREVQLTCGDYKEQFEKYKERSDVLTFCDPPYISDREINKKSVKSINKKVVKETNGYVHPFTIKDHKVLMDNLLSTKNKVLLFGYRNEFYKRLEENGFQRHFIGLVNVPSSGKAKKVKEYIWYNFETPEYLLPDEPFDDEY
jgi:site-specific DNA-adenine methylase